MLIKSVVDGMIERKFGRIISITSAAVKAPVSTLGLSNGNRTGLTGFLAGLARQPVAAIQAISVDRIFFWMETHFQEPCKFALQITESALKNSVELMAFFILD